MKRLPLAPLLPALIGFLMTISPALGQAGGEKPAADEVAALTVTITSSADESRQKALFFVPDEARAPAAKAAPLLVALHTWSTDYTRCAEYVPKARSRKWILIAPDFRGRNDRPEACASALAVQDVIDAVAYAAKNAPVDRSRIYLVGVSGGGHMALVMAAKAPRIWAGVSAWASITDLAAWHRECRAADLGYWKSLEKICSGPPGPETQAEYRARSPLFHLAAAKGLPVDINAGIHDGHSGSSVPVSHSLFAWNVLAAANGHKDRQVTTQEIEFMVRQERVPEALAATVQADPTRKKAVLFRREAGPARITIFDGGHEIEVDAALDWLARQKRTAPADVGQKKPADTETTRTAEGTRRVHIFISGRVQGVGFRNFTVRAATKLGLVGWVRNLPDRRVEAVVEGPKDKVADLLRAVEKGPPAARVDKVDVTDEQPKGDFTRFERRR